MNEERNQYNERNYYENYGTDPEREPYKNRSDNKKTGVGKIILVTFSMMLLVGVAALGGYSAHEIWDYFSQSEQKEEESLAEYRIPESVAQNPTIIVNQEENSGFFLTDVSGVVEAVMPSVVSVTNTALYTNNSFSFGFWQTPQQQYYADSCGSGIIVGQNESELLIVTNNHVIEDNVSLTVQFVDESTAEALVKGADPSNDLAVIAVSLNNLSAETRQEIQIAALGNSDELKMGQGVIAIGNALGYGQSVTEGIISALHREITTEDGNSLSVLQTSAAINPGNSGGALLNMYGEVIGINVAKSTANYSEGMGFAIPISEVKDLMEDMMSWEIREKVPEEKAGYLGISPLNVDSTSASSYGMPMGVYAYSVLENSPAKKGGMKEKDIIVSMDHYSIRNVSDLQEALAYFEGGDTVEVVVMRLMDGSYQEVKLSVTLGYKRDYTD